MDGPDIAAIDKGAGLEHPEEFGSILERHVETNVATLIDEVRH